MTDLIRFNIYVTVKEGRLEDFKQIARDWSARNLNERAYVRSYEWFFLGEDETDALVIEVFNSSEEILATMERTSEAESVEEPDYPYEMIKMEVCGEISDALRARLNSGKTKIEYYRRFEGFTR